MRSLRSVASKCKYKYKSKYNKLSIIPIRRCSGYSIHPSIGIARLGNAMSMSKSSGDWYVAPTRIGGLPSKSENESESVEKFKNLNGSVKRQAAKFTVYKNGEPLKLNEVKDIKWKCWLANKKGIWYQFDKLNGDVMLANNTYEIRGTPLRNIKSKDGTVVYVDRQKFIINPGPREVSLSSNQSTAKFEKNPDDPNSNFPLDALQANGVFAMEPFVITSLGDMNMNTESEEDASLYVRGGHGLSGGDPMITLDSFAGGDLWFDDTSDGPVECEITFKDETQDPISLKAYVVCASPKYAPELVNINTWDDVVFDMSVRFYNGFAPNMIDYNTNRYILNESGFKPNIEYDIKPIFDRMKDYQWVCNVAPMVAFATPPFKVVDYNPSTEAIEKRRKWFSFLREAINLQSADVNEDQVAKDPHQLLYSGDVMIDPTKPDGQTSKPNTFPMMPLNAGSGSVQRDASLAEMSKFLTMTPTQYYMLYQYCEGHTSNEIFNFGLNDLDRASVGNCVGYPASPGIEVTWNVRNPNLYLKDDPYRIDAVNINDIGKLAMESRDECEGGGVEPGDLSKRMAIPWQADFTACTAQPINFTNPTVNKSYDDPESAYPQYYVYWWPAQAPMNVYLPAYTPEQQALEIEDPAKDSILFSGQQVYFQRGLPADAATYDAVVHLWSHYGFIVNSNDDSETRKEYPNFVETERDLELFHKLPEIERKDWKRAREIARSPVLN